MRQETDTFYTFVVGGGAASAAFLLGGFDRLVVALAICMAADYLSGVLVGFFREKKISSERAFHGLLKKGAMILLVIVSHQLDVVAGSTDSQFMRNAMIMFLIAVEGISLVENMGRLGVPVPAFLRQRFEQMKNDNDKEAKF
ncbi:holin family protein (plasmid) [Aneurinibacillus thermoaerophilus]|uniref:Phage holin family protein n=6 Tax=Aneurinibacillus thermoaerophilus TaxID=143495 RepID=A0ABX8YC56_ANETH|nr:MULTISPECIES: phage holin family protein [Aneurinibacillus]AMA72942.1 holin [Aneurinibacillus sp. XH2]AMA74316.1 holin [Aneurinibacillus sp. XH2]MED0757424.1 phage holin family protein [Aneurinibacillus thermoaerophilus]QYY43101.1 phage holin family protein [Aneurinibacillus thermoaerophilus]QYY44796.1 phage holin family protein [Aneurinibacillus thermoaerophilus]